MLSKKFILAGHAIFTVSNPVGEHYTYKVSIPKDFNEDRPIYFFSLLTGPDNTRDYTYYGYFFPNNGEFRYFGNKKIPQINSSKPFLVFVWALTQIFNEKPLAEGYKIEHCGFCGKCGRTLTTPESIERGLGPICFEN